MRQILLIGTGKSTSYLIDYLLQRVESEQITLTLADKVLDMIPLDFSRHPNCDLLELDIEDPTARQSAIAKADLVISMLPARFHDLVATDCLALKKHLLTASYVSPTLKDMK